MNSIFNPAFIDDLYPRTADGRSALLKDARSTNYGVVRLELIEALYEHMYEQRRELGPDERLWPHRIHGATEVTGLDNNDGTANSEQGPLRLRVRSLRDQADDVLDIDLVIAATGYQRTSHLTMMQKVAPLLPGLQGKQGPLTDRDVQVGRDYGVRFAPGKVAKGSGIWLQGCNEKTHGVCLRLNTNLDLLDQDANFETLAAERYAALGFGHSVRRDCRIHLRRRQCRTCESQTIESSRYVHVITNYSQHDHGR